MSQQQMEFEGSYRDGPSSSPGYGGVPPYHTYSPGLQGQKLSVPVTNHAPSPGQRLALAIVSLILWLLLFLFVVFGVASSSGFAAPAATTVPPLLVIGLLMFTSLVILFNVLFNRRR